MATSALALQHRLRVLGSAKSITIGNTKISEYERHHTMFDLLKEIKHTDVIHEVLDATYVSNSAIKQLDTNGKTSCKQLNEK